MCVKVEGTLEIRWLRQMGKTEAQRNRMSCLATTNRLDTNPGLFTLRVVLFALI